MTIAIDFDGTIVEDRYPQIGRPRLFAFETLKRLQQDGHRLILWTCRQGAELEAAVSFCHAHGVDFYAVNCNDPEERPEHLAPRKLICDLWIDDRSLGGLPDWGVIYKMISSNPYVPYVEDPELDVQPKRNLIQRILGV